MRKRHATVLNTATWAQEYFGKPFSLNKYLRIHQKMLLWIFDTQEESYTYVQCSDAAW